MNALYVYTNRQQNVDNFFHLLYLLKLCKYDFYYQLYNQVFEKLKSVRFFLDKNGNYIESSVWFRQWCPSGIFVRGLALLDFSGTFWWTPDHLWTFLHRHLQSAKNESFLGKRNRGGPSWEPWGSPQKNYLSSWIIRNSFPEALN